MLVTAPLTVRVEILLLCAADRKTTSGTNFALEKATKGGFLLAPTVFSLFTPPR